MSVQPSYRPAVEPLETRDLLAAGITASVVKNYLIVQGTTGNDYIQVSQAEGKLSVHGTNVSVDAGPIKKVVINSYAGDDVIAVATLSVDAIITSGAGNDRIYGGLSNDIIDGGAGHDLLSGNSGNDRILSGVAAAEQDTMLGGGGFNWYWRPFNAYRPFVNGQAISDIRQGAAPLCQTSAALAEAVLQGHDFAKDIRYLGAGVFDVKLHGAYGTQKVKFDGWTNDSDPVMTAGEFWTVLEQRARLQALGIDWRVEHTRAEWNAIDKSKNGRLYSIAEALNAFTGSAAAYGAIDTARPQALQAALARGDYVVAQSRAATGVSGDGIVGYHAYAVLAVYQDSDTWNVRLYNTWAKDRENGSTIDSLDKSGPAANDGFITLTWSQFANPNNFKGIFMAPKK
jgi:hypothetical protein